MSKTINYSPLHTILSRIVKGLDLTHPELGKALRKWHPYIFKAVINTSKITNLAEEDVLSDILLGLAQVNDLCDEPLYRYQKRLYKIILEDGNSVLLESKCKDRIRFWVAREGIEEVQCAKTESLLYTKIQQCCVQLIRSKHAQKREGNQVNIDSLDYIRDLSSTFDSSIYPSSLEITEYLIDIQKNPEEVLSTFQFIEGLTSYISEEALVVLGDFINNPGTSFIASARRLGISRRKARAARLEILRIFSYLEQTRIKAVGCRPIYMRADQLC